MKSEDWGNQKPVDLIVRGFSRYPHKYMVGNGQVKYSNMLYARYQLPGYLEPNDFFNVVAMFVKQITEDLQMKGIDYSTLVWEVHTNLLTNNELMRVDD